MISTSGHLIPKFPEVRFHRTRIFKHAAPEKAWRKRQVPVAAECFGSPSSDASGIPEAYGRSFHWPAQSNQRHSGSTVYFSWQIRTILNGLKNKSSISISGDLSPGYIWCSFFLFGISGLLLFLQLSASCVLRTLRSVNALNGLTPISTMKMKLKEMMEACVNALNGLTPISTVASRNPWFYWLPRAIFTSN